VNLAVSLGKAAPLYPGKNGMVCGNRRFTHRQAASHVQRRAAVLADQGIEKGPAQQ